MQGAGSSCDVAGAAGCVLYHVNALWALRRVAEGWDGEVEPVITVAGGRVASRGIRFKSQLGSWKGLRFTYGKNMAGCTRTVLEQDVYTALYGFGAGLPVTDEDGRYTGGYRKKLTFGEVNGGGNWIGDEDARLVWGRWNADRTAKVHSFGQVTFSECDDPARLLVLTRKALADAVVTDKAQIQQCIFVQRAMEHYDLLTPKEAHDISAKVWGAKKTDPTLAKNLNL